MVIYLTDMEIMDEIEQIDAGIDPGRSVEELCSGGVPERIKRAERLTIPIEFIRMWDGSKRALSVRERLLRNKKAPRELFEFAWADLKETAARESFSLSEQRVEQVQLMMSAENGAMLILDDLDDLSSRMRGIAAFLLLGMSADQRRDECLSHQLNPQLALAMYARSNIDARERLALAKLLAAEDKQIASLALGLITELARNQGGFISTLGIQVRERCASNWAVLERMRELVQAGIDR